MKKDSNTEEVATGRLALTASVSAGAAAAGASPTEVLQRNGGGGGGGGSVGGKEKASTGDKCTLSTQAATMLLRRHGPKSTVLSTAVRSLKLSA